MEIQKSIGYLLNISAKLIKRKMDKLLEEDNLTTAQWAVIKLLDSKGGLPPAKIAEELNSDRATVGSVIDRLLDKDLVEKKPDPNDRRSFSVILTEEGRKIVPKIEGFTKHINETTMKGINDNEIMIFYGVMSKIIKNLSNEEIEYNEK